MIVRVNSHFESSGLRCEMIVVRLEWVSGCDIIHPPSRSKIETNSKDFILFSKILKSSSQVWSRINNIFGPS